MFKRTAGLLLPVLILALVLHLQRQEHLVSAGRIFLPGVLNYFSCDTVYRIKPGDSCASIAALFEIRVSLLIWKNKKLDCKKPQVGMRLCVDDWL